jgi:hypothetical protein
VLDEPLPVLDEPLPVLDEPLPVLDEPLPVLDEPLPVLDEPLPVLDEPLPELDEPLSVLDEPLPVLDEPLPVLDEPLPVLDEPLPVLDEPLPVLDEPLLVPVLDEPLLKGSLLDDPAPELDPELLVGDGGAPLPSVSVSSTRMPGSTLITSLRVPALMTSDCTLDVEQVMPTPSTEATMELPLLARVMSIVLVCPAVPVHTSTPSTRLGVTVSRSLDSKASSPTKTAAGRARLRRRFLPLACGLTPGKRWLEEGTRSPPVRFSRAIFSPQGE